MKKEDKKPIEVEKIPKSGAFNDIQKSIEELEKLKQQREEILQRVRQVSNTNK
ncbi:hypothetical protein [Eisenibacter elegans]|jgi:hypothetical protein|uniref:hypothetical protein n=1 Tax=Eisenibacter elegans TaxID=997 RepID=UPI000415949E|nr:hypothetical protein [Eisenibacter elegans]